MSIELAKRLSKDEQAGNHPYIRPKDASTLLILDRSNGAEPKILMGRRHMRHTFMPGKFVFPGGRVDPADSRVSVAEDYHPLVAKRLSKNLKGAKTEARVRAFSVAAIRETYEEAGVFVGRKNPDCRLSKRGQLAGFGEHKVELDLSPVRMIARAITPPSRPRRFDARFLAVWADAIAHQLPEGTGPSGELEDISWLTLDEARALELPIITQKILEELEARLADDPDLSPETEVPFYYMRGTSFLRETL